MMRSGRTQAESLLEEGERAETSGDNGSALARYEAALQADALLIGAHQHICSLLRRLGRPDGALVAAEAFAASSPSEAASHLELGLCLLELHRSAEAAREFRLALELGPQLRAAWKGLGFALGQMGETEEAFRCIDRSEERLRPTVDTGPPPRSCVEIGESVHDMMACMMEAGGGSALIVAEAPFSFKASVAILGVLLKDYDMDGVVVSVARPADVYKRALAKRVQSSHPPLFVEISASPEEMTSADRARSSGRSLSPAADSAVGGDVTVLSAFEPDRIASSVRAGLQKAAQKYGGEEHFVLMDDMAAMEAYNGTGVVRNFASRFFKELASLGIFTFVVLPEAQAPRLLGQPVLTMRWKLRVTGSLLADA